MNKIDFEKYLSDEKNYKFLERVTKKYYDRYYKVKYVFEFEDIFQDVLLRLSKAWNTWNLDKFALGTYIDKTIQSEVDNKLDCVNSKKNFLVNKTTHYSLDFMIGEYGEGNSIHDVVVGTNSIEECEGYNLHNETIIKFIDSLKTNEQKAIFLYRMNGLQHKEIAKRIGKKERYVIHKYHVMKEQLKKII